jgi:tRNA(adenine34) deaminase
MDNINTTWMKEALFLAQKAATAGEVPVGALILKDEKIIGRGYNMREGLNNPIAHAEILAIQEATQSLKSWRLVDCTLFVTLEPCPMCLAALQQSRIAKVIYAAVDKKGGALSLGYRLHEDPRTNHRFSVEQIEMTECGEILTRFFAKRRAET